MHASPNSVEKAYERNAHRIRVSSAATILSQKPRGLLVVMVQKSLGARIFAYNVLGWTYATTSVSRKRMTVESSERLSSLESSWQVR